MGVGGLGGLAWSCRPVDEAARRHGLGGSCDGQNNSNSDQPDHCHLHMNLGGACDSLADSLYTVGIISALAEAKDRIAKLEKGEDVPWR